MSLGETISRLRKSKGMSQELLAENTNISLRTIQRIETNASTPRAYTLKTLADALGVPMEELGTLSSTHTEPKIEGEIYSRLTSINFSALAGLIVPLGNIILPLILWKRSGHLPEVRSIGRRIISFQIIWTLVMLLFTFTIPVIQYSFLQSYVIGRFPPTVIVVYITFLVVNLLFILRAAVRLNGRDTNIYSSIPALF